MKNSVALRFHCYSFFLNGAPALCSAVSITGNVLTRSALFNPSVSGIRKKSINRVVSEAVEHSPGARL